MPGRAKGLIGSSPATVSPKYASQPRKKVRLKNIEAKREELFDNDKQATSSATNLMLLMRRKKSKNLFHL